MIATLLWIGLCLLGAFVLATRMQVDELERRMDSADRKIMDAQETASEDFDVLNKAIGELNEKNQ